MRIQRRKGAGSLGGIDLAERFRARHLGNHLDIREEFLALVIRFECL